MRVKMANRDSKWQNARQYGKGRVKTAKCKSKRQNASQYSKMQNFFQILFSLQRASRFEKWAPGLKDFPNLVISQMGLWDWEMGPWIWKFFKSCHLPNGPLGLKNGPLVLKFFSNLVISKISLWVWKMGPWFWKFFKSCHLPNGLLGFKNGPLVLKIF